MQVPGLLRKNNYGERFDLLMNRATDIFNVLLSRAATTPRNYIIDQTNVYKSARKRKLKPFVFFRKVSYVCKFIWKDLYSAYLTIWVILCFNFQFQIAVVVFPSPEVLSVHSKKIMEEMGKEVPVEAVNNMLGNGSSTIFVLLMFIMLLYLRGGLYFWQPILFYLSARICVVQMSTSTW